MGKRTPLKRLKKQADSIKNPQFTSGVPKIDERLKRVFFISLFSLVFILGLVLRISNLNVSSRRADELFYLKYAKAVTENGINITKTLVEEYRSNKEAWMYPTPIRIGYIYLVSAVMNTVRSTDIRILSYVSSAFSIIALLILILFGLRFFNPWITLSALLFISVSPMDLAIARRAWQDGVLGVFGLLLIYLCCEISLNPKRKIWYLFFWMIGGYSILVKESGIVIYSLCVLWLAGISLFREKSILKSLNLVLLSSIIAALGFFVLESVSGGPQNIIETIKNNMSSIETNGYAIEYQSGPWYSYFQCLFILSPVVTLLSGLGITRLAFFVFFAKPIAGINDKRYAFLGFLFFIASYAVIAIIPKHMINLRYISVLFVPFYLMSGLGLWCISSFLKSTVKGFSFHIAVFIIALASIIVAINDYNTFERTFIQKETRDISIGLLKQGIANKY